MAGGGASDQDGMITEINVTPLVDIILVLLITFMITANLIDKQAIALTLPKAASGDKAPPTPLALTLGRDGSLYLNGQPVGEAALRQALVEVGRKDPEAQAIIAADKDVSHGQVVHLIDLVRQSGIFKFAFNIDPAAPPPAAAVP